MAKYASKVVEQAKAWLGRNEASGTHKAIIDVYNSHKPLARGYKVKYTDEWCATFVSAVAVKLGYTDIIPTECGCEKMIELFKKLGAWQENEAVTPKPGWIIFYDWQDNGVGDNKGYSDHTGIVEKVSNGKITLIEGNYKTAVTRRELAVNARYIRGYGVPKYDGETASSTTTATKPTTSNVDKGVCKLEIKQLRKGSEGNTVKALQTLLIGYGYKMQNGNKTYGADGSFGTATENAVIAYQKKVFPNDKSQWDGIVGTNTWNKLLGIK